MGRGGKRGPAEKFIAAFVMGALFSVYMLGYHDFSVLQARRKPVSLMVVQNPPMVKAAAITCH